MMNIVTKKPKSLNLKLLKEETEHLTEPEKCRLVFEYMAVLEFFYEW